MATENCRVICKKSLCTVSAMRSCAIFTVALAAAAALSYSPVRKWAGGHPNPFATVDLTGKNVIVTGANTGIGIVTAMQLYRQGANSACAN